jgi:hypothetical protein
MEIYGHKLFLIISPTEELRDMLSGKLGGQSTVPRNPEPPVIIFTLSSPCISYIVITFTNKFATQHTDSTRPGTTQQGHKKLITPTDTLQNLPNIFGSALFHE